MWDNFVQRFSSVLGFLTICLSVLLHWIGGFLWPFGIFDHSFPLSVFVTTFGLVRIMRKGNNYDNDQKPLAKLPEMLKEPLQLQVSTNPKDLKFNCKMTFYINFQRVSAQYLTLTLAPFCCFLHCFGSVFRLRPFRRAVLMKAQKKNALMLLRIMLLDPLWLSTKIYFSLYFQFFEDKSVFVWSQSDVRKILFALQKKRRQYLQMIGANRIFFSSCYCCCWKVPFLIFCSQLFFRGKVGVRHVWTLTLLTLDLLISEKSLT